MSSPLDAAFISHIREAIGWIESYLAGIDEVEFRNTKLIQDGVVRQLEIIGDGETAVLRDTERPTRRTVVSDREDA